jgi:hypothetical protein
MSPSLESVTAPFRNTPCHHGFLQAQQQLRNGTTPVQKIAVLALKLWFTPTAKAIFKLARSLHE